MKGWLCVWDIWLYKKINNKIDIYYIIIKLNMQYILLKYIIYWWN